MAKVTHTVTGTTDTVEGPACIYYADFTTPGGTGSVQLQMLFDGDWLPADTAQTATMQATELADCYGFQQFRLNVTVTTGSVVTYLRSAP